VLHQKPANSRVFDLLNLIYNIFALNYHRPLPSLCHLKQLLCWIETNRTRLKSLVKAKNGFELAELDMMTRGIGTLNDCKQWGISDLAMEAIKNPKLVEVAQREARLLIENDPELINHPLLLTHLEGLERT
jgi:ATP-dependent DNA helicase RecG